MRNPRFTLSVWSIYELALGVALFLIPGQMLDLVRIDRPTELWPIRMIGVVVVLAGIFYFAGTVADNRAFYRWTVFGRIIVAGGIGAVSVIDGPWQLWLSAIVDALGAAWTFGALRPDRAPLQGETAPGSSTPEPTTES